MELRVTHGAETVTVAVVHITHPTGAARGHCELVSIHQYPLTEWSADPLGCMRPELELIAGSRFLIDGRR